MTAPPKSRLPILAPRAASVGERVDVLYADALCIHARHCVLEQPRAFKPNVVGDWIDPDAASAEEVVTVAHMCPSGAIAYVRRDGERDEVAPKVNLIQLRENGPLGVRAELVIDGVAVGYRATLCRCGASRNKPFCDRSHVELGFTATAEPATRASDPLAIRAGRLEVTQVPDGPLVVRGSVEICSGTGRTIDRATEVALCRCGGSGTKPFCDGTHERIGFRT